MKYNCKWCNKEFELSKYQISILNKQPTKLLFCSKQCSGKYYAKKSHENKTPEQEQIRRDKISKTLKQKENTLTEKEKQLRTEKLNSYWKNLSTEQRSIRNKNNAIKSKQTKLERYGSETYNNEEQRKQTNLKKYGVSNTLRTEKAIQKAKDTNIEKYGTEFFFKNREAFEKVSLQKYGTKHPMQNKEVKEKLTNTKFINWGDYNYNNQKKFEETFKQRYGVRRPFHLKIFKEKSDNTKLKRYGSKTYNNRNKALKTIYKKYGEDYYKHQTINNLGSRISKINKAFAEFAEIKDFEFPIQQKSYDLKINNTLIEIDPVFTHNCLKNGIYNKFGGLEKDYHYNKSKLAKDNGYRCIHIFDWDDWNKIRYMLQDKETLQARKLNYKEVDKETCDIFLNEYHIQNTCRGQEVRLGLFTQDNKLVQIMTFGKPRYNKNYEWELLRLCSHKDYKIIGGAKKLFTHFLLNYKPINIISYCDFGKFDGNVYLNLGFKQFNSVSLNKHWVKGNEHITDNLLRQRGYDQLFKTNYGKGTSNEQLMLENGWLPIYDAGQLTFIWKK